jgi:hypothetical protein
MPLRRKPDTAGSDIDERQVDHLIDKGGTVAVDTLPPVARKHASMPLRLDPALVARIDRARGRRPVPPSRIIWIVEALLEKLARDNSR